MILVCGEALIDLVPVTVEMNLLYKPLPGGSPYNVAIGLSRLGIPCSYLGKVSTDSFGDKLVDILRQEEVGTEYLVRSLKPTTISFPNKSIDGGDEFSFYGVGTADQMMKVEELPHSLPDTVHSIHIGSYSIISGETSETLKTLIERENSRRVITIDPNVRPHIYPDHDKYLGRLQEVIKLVNIVKTSSQDIAWQDPGQSEEYVAHKWLEYGPQFFVITRGSNGAVAFGNGWTVSVRSPSVIVADTIGAGDAFMSALLAKLDSMKLLNKKGISTLSTSAAKQCLSYACNAASISCTKQGASPPHMDEL